MSTIKVNTVTKRTGSTLTLGESGTTVTLACGASQTGFGRTGTVDWCTTAKTSPFTSVNGKGYFVNTTSGAVTVTLPSSPSAGDIIALKDYGNTWDTNAVTLCRNGSKINGACANATLNTESQSVTLIYVDGTKGWQDVQDSTSNVTGTSYVTATGGTITTCGNFKIHTFTGDGCFQVTCAGNASGSNKVSYVVVAGGASAGASSGANAPGGGGAGGFREGRAPAFDSYTASPLVAPDGLPVSVQTYPITVGGGGATQPRGPGGPGTGVGAAGSNSVFSTITSAGGGAPQGAYNPGNAGGSGAGGAGGTGTVATGGAGNTPPVSPPQGQPGGEGGGSPAPDHQSGGGGGAGGAGTKGSPSGAGVGGVGVSTSITGSSLSYAGGGGGSGYGPVVGSGLQGNGSPCGTGGQGVISTPDVAGSGTTNRGGGGGAATCSGASQAGAGGSGVVIIRYKFQN